MASSPLFLGTPKLANIILNNSNGGDPAYTAPTTIATILTMAAAGRIDTVSIRPVGTNASCSVRLFIDTVGTGATNNRLVYDASLPVSTSSVVSALQGVVWSPGLVLPIGAVLRGTVANTSVTLGYAVTVEYGEF